MLKLALRNTRARFKGYISSIIAIFLGVTFVASTLSLQGLLTNTFDSLVNQSFSAAAFVRAEGSSMDVVNGTMSDTNIPLDLVDTLNELPGVAAAEPAVQSNIVLVGSDGMAVATSGAPTLMIGTYPGPQYTILSGRYPAGDNEIMFTDQTMAKTGFKLGDSVKTVVAGEIHNFTLVGEVEFGAAAGALVTFVHETVGEKLLAPTGKTGIIALYSDAQESGSDFILTQEEERSFVDQLTSSGLSLTASDGTALELVTGTELREDSSKDIRKQVGFIVTMVLAFAAVALLVSSFVIANTFAMVTRQQQREFALIRALGANPGQVFSIVVLQALVVGLVGSGLGLLAAAGVLAALPGLFASIGMDLASGGTLSGSTVAVSLIVGAVVAVLAATISARKAALVAPLEAMRDVAAPNLFVSTWRVAIGAAVAALGGAAMTAAVAGSGSNQLSQPDGLYALGALALVVGAIMVVPALVAPASRLFTAPLKRTMRPVAGLAGGNLQRNPKRTAATASALVLGATLTSAAAVIAASVNTSVGAILKQELHADLIVNSQSFVVAPSAVEALEDLDSVSQTGVFASALVEIPQLKVSSDSGKKTLDIGATESATMESLWTATILEGSADALSRGEMLVQKSVLEENGWELGQEVTLARATVAGGDARNEDDQIEARSAATSASGELSIRIGAVFESPALGVPLLVDLEQLSGIVPSDLMTIHNVLISSNGPTDELRRDVVKALSPYLVLSVYDQSEFTSSVTNQIDQMLTVVYALLALSIVIAILGIANTLGLGILERTREIGLLRAVGLSNSQLRSMISLEALVTALIGALVGVGLGVLATSGIPRIFESSGFTDLTIPIPALVTTIAVCAVAGLAASWWPAFRAARVPVLTAIGAKE